MANAKKKKTLKLSEIIQINTGLNMIGGKELPVALSWKISRFQQDLEPTLKTYEEKNKELVKKYGEENKDKPGTYTIEPNKLENFNKDKEALFSQEEEIDIPEFSFSKDFGGIDSLTPTFFKLIAPIIKD